MNTNIQELVTNARQITKEELEKKQKALSIESKKVEMQIETAIKRMKTVTGKTHLALAVFNLSVQVQLRTDKPGNHTTLEEECKQRIADQTQKKTHGTDQHQNETPLLSMPVTALVKRYYNPLISQRHVKCLWDWKRNPLTMKGLEEACQHLCNHLDDNNDNATWEITMIACFHLERFDLVLRLFSRARDICEDAYQHYTSQCLSSVALSTLAMQPPDLDRAWEYISKELLKSGIKPSYSRMRPYKKMPL